MEEAGSGWPRCGTPLELVFLERLEGVFAHVGSRSTEVPGPWRSGPGTLREWPGTLGEVARALGEWPGTFRVRPWDLAGVALLN